MNEDVGARTSNLDYVRAQWAGRLLPADLTGKTIMDVGCWAGGFAKVALEKGAARAIGVDVCRSPKLHDGVEFHQVDITTEAAMLLPKVDYVFLFGVLYHTMNPVGLLAAARRLALDTVFVETAYWSARQGVVMGTFGDEDYTNWFRPSCPMVEWMMRRIGLEPGKPSLIDDKRMAIAGKVVEPMETLPRERGGMKT